MQPLMFVVLIHDGAPKMQPWRLPYLYIEPWWLDDQVGLSLEAAILTAQYQPDPARHESLLSAMYNAIGA